MYKVYLFQCDTCQQRQEELVNTNKPYSFSCCNKQMKRVPGGFGWRADRVEGHLPPVMDPIITARDNTGTQYD